MINFWVGIGIGFILGAIVGTMIACLMIGCISDEE